jgi:hypothetical protein
MVVWAAPSLCRNPGQFSGRAPRSADVTAAMSTMFAFDCQWWTRVGNGGCKRSLTFCSIAHSRPQTTRPWQAEHITVPNPAMLVGPNHADAHATQHRHGAKPVTLHSMQTTPGCLAGTTWCTPRLPLLHNACGTRSSAGTQQTDTHQLSPARRSLAQAEQAPSSCARAAAPTNALDSWGP